jgi:hypothetical protein
LETNLQNTHTTINNLDMQLQKLESKLSESEQYLNELKIFDVYENKKETRNLIERNFMELSIIITEMTQQNSNSFDKIQKTMSIQKDAIDDQIKELNQNIQLLSDFLKSTNEELVKSNEKLILTHNRLEDIESKLIKINIMNEELSNLTLKLEETNEIVIDINGSIQSIDDSISDYEERLIKLRGDVDKCEDDIATSSTEIRVSLMAVVDDRQTEIEDKIEQVREELETTINELIERQDENEQINANFELKLQAEIDSRDGPDPESNDVIDNRNNNPVEKMNRKSIIDTKTIKSNLRRSMSISGHKGLGNEVDVSASTSDIIVAPIVKAKGKQKYAINSDLFDQINCYSQNMADMCVTFENIAVEKTWVPNFPTNVCDTIALTAQEVSELIATIADNEAIKAVLNQKPTSVDTLQSHSNINQTSQVLNPEDEYSISDRRLVLIDDFMKNIADKVLKVLPQPGIIRLDAREKFFKQLFKVLEIAISKHDQVSYNDQKIISNN